MGRRLDRASRSWQRMRAKIINRDKTCFVCTTTQNLTVHHIKPRKHGGKTVERNLSAMCEPCHDFVELHDLEWAATIKLQFERRLQLSEESIERQGDKLIGRDKFGVFIIHGAKPYATVAYDGTWPIAVEASQVPYRRRY